MDGDYDRVWLTDESIPLISNKLLQAPRSNGASGEGERLSVLVKVVAGLRDLLRYVNHERDFRGCPKWEEM